MRVKLKLTVFLLIFIHFVFINGISIAIVRTVRLRSGILFFFDRRITSLSDIRSERIFRRKLTERRR